MNTSNASIEKHPGLKGNVVDYLMELRMSPQEVDRPYLVCPGDL